MSQKQADDIRKVGYIRRTISVIRIARMYAGRK